MPARMILFLISGMLFLPVFPQDGPSTPGDTSEVSDDIVGLMKRAEQGDAFFQHLLGSNYEIGREAVPRDYQEAVRWYRAAAEQGYMLAQFDLGQMYDEGQGVPQNYKEAVRWYRAAAEQGFMLAQFNLGQMYDEGQGVPQNYKEAVRWHQAAAEQRHPPSQNNLGNYYLRGQGVPQDYIQAHMWYNLAASDLTGDDRELPANNRDSIAEKMTAEQIAEAQRLAREWKPKSGGQ